MSNRSWKRVILGSIFLVLSIFYTVLFFQKANFNNTMIFNIAHIRSLENIFTSPINFNYWNHSGSQINLFSPWLTILSGFVFVNFNVTYGFSIYLTLITFLTFVSAYYYMNKFSKDTMNSLLFSVVYTFSLNRFFQVFHNQRIENYLVLIFLPMIYYGAYSLLKAESRTWQTLVWGLTLTVWTSPYMAIATVITLIPFVILMIFSKSTHDWRYWGKLVLNILIVVGMLIMTTVGFLGPLIIQVLQHSFKQNEISNPNYLLWFQKLNLSSIQQYLLLGIAILIVLLLIMIFLQSSFAYKLILLETIPLAAIMLLKINLQYIDISRIIPAFQSILGLFVTIILCRIVILVFQEGPSIFKLILMVITIFAMSFSIYAQANQLKPDKTLMAADNINYQKYVEDYHDHATNGQNRFLINGKKTAVSFYTKASDYWVQYHDPESAIMDLPVQNYSGYKIQLNNEAVKTRESTRKTLELRTNPGQNIIEIHTNYDLIGILSLLINLLGFILLAYLSLTKTKWFLKKSSVNG